MYTFKCIPKIVSDISRQTFSPPPPTSKSPPKWYTQSSLFQVSSPSSDAVARLTCCNPFQIKYLTDKFMKVKFKLFTKFYSRGPNQLVLSIPARKKNILTLRATGERESVWVSRNRNFFLLHAKISPPDLIQHPFVLWWDYEKIHDKVAEETAQENEVKQIQNTEIHENPVLKGDIGERVFLLSMPGFAFIRICRKMRGRCGSRLMCGLVVGSKSVFLDSRFGRAAQQQSCGKQSCGGILCVFRCCHITICLTWFHLSLTLSSDDDNDDGNNLIIQSELLYLNTLPIRNCGEVGKV